MIWVGVGGIAYMCIVGALLGAIFRRHNEIKEQLEVLQEHADALIERTEAIEARSRRVWEEALRIASR